MKKQKDFMIVSIMTLVYLVIALYRLGGFQVPKTFWKASRAGENFIIDLGKQANVSRIYYYTGLGYGQYRVEYLDEQGNFSFVTFLDNPKDEDDKLGHIDFYKLQYVSVSVNTGQLKFIVDEPGNALHEIAIYEEGAENPLTGINIVSQDVDVNDKGTVADLFDEPDTMKQKPSFMNSTYFDEIYHARTAYEHLHRIEPYETTHPPLGKLFIALGIAIFGMNPFGWRIIGTLFGAAMIPMMYAFGKKVFGTRFYAFCCAFLMMFDFMHFAQTRIATIDVYATFFTILMYYYMYDYFVKKSYEVGFKQSLKPLFLSGLFFGLGIASKWICAYAAAGLALLFFTAKLLEYIDYVKLSSNKKYRNTPWLEQFVPLYWNKTIICCVLFFVIIPVILYVLSYIPFMMVPGPGHDLGAVWRYQKHMFDYHSKLKATHPFSSSWFEWPIMKRPIWYYSGSDLPEGRVSTIVSMGNPAIWWIGIAAVCYAFILSVQKRDKKMAVVFIGMIFQYVPWMLVKRLTFIYHFFSIVPFVMICIVYVIQHLMESNQKYKYVVYGYLAVVAILFLWFYPALSGLEVSAEYIKHLRWFKSWTF